MKQYVPQFYHLAKWAFNHESNLVVRSDGSGPTVTSQAQEYARATLWALSFMIGPRVQRADFSSARATTNATWSVSWSVLPYQQALLLLRLCVQHNLRHLMRGLDTSDIPELWQICGRYRRRDSPYPKQGRTTRSSQIPHRRRRDRNSKTPRYRYTIPFEYVRPPQGRIGGAQRQRTRRYQYRR